jgi:hypothetical protein
LRCTGEESRMREDDGQVGMDRVASDDRVWQWTRSREGWSRMVSTQGSRRKKKMHNRKSEVDVESDDDQ